MSRIKIKMTELTPRMAQTKDYTFEVDPTKSNTFKLTLDLYRSIYVVVEAKKWWEFWK